MVGDGQGTMGRGLTAKRGGGRTAGDLFPWSGAGVRGGEGGKGPPAVRPIRALGRRNPPSVQSLVTRN